MLVIEASIESSFSRDSSFFRTSSSFSLKLSAMFSATIISSVSPMTYFLSSSVHLALLSRIVLVKFDLNF